MAQDLNELHSRVGFALARVKRVERDARVAKQALADALETIGDLRSEEDAREDGNTEEFAGYLEGK